MSSTKTIGNHRWRSAWARWGHFCYLHVSTRSSRWILRRSLASRGGKSSWPLITMCGMPSVAGWALRCPHFNLKMDADGLDVVIKDGSFLWRNNLSLHFTKPHSLRRTSSLKQGISHCVAPSKVRLARLGRYIDLSKNYVLKTATGGWWAGGMVRLAPLGRRFGRSLLR